MKRLRKFLHLSSTDRRLLLRAMILLSIIRVGLRLLPFHRLNQLLTRIMHAPVGQNRSNSSFPHRIAWAVEAASRHFHGTGICLPQALTGQVMLRQEGYPAHVTVGVTRVEEGRMEAHAWVESEGKVVIGGTHAESYARLLTLDGEEL